MGIPNVSTMLMPLLKLCKDKNEQSYREAIEYLSSFFKLSNDDRKELLPSSGIPVFDNRVGWTQSERKHSSLIESTRREYFRITNRGLEALSQNILIDKKFLRQYPEYLDYHHHTKKDTEDSKVDHTLDKTPEEIFEDSYQTINRVLMQEVLEKVKSSIIFKAFFSA
jgi:restriction system protein